MYSRVTRYMVKSALRGRNTARRPAGQLMARPRENVSIVVLRTSWSDGLGGFMPRLGLRDQSRSSIRLVLGGQLDKSSVPTSISSLMSCWPKPDARL